MQKKSKMHTETNLEGVLASGQEQQEAEFVACSLITPGLPLRVPDYEDKRSREPQGFYENPFNKSLDWLKNQHHDQPIQPEEDHIERIPEWSTTQNPPSTVAKSTMATATVNQVPAWTTVTSNVITITTLPSVTSCKKESAATRTCTATLPATSTISLGTRTVTSAAVIPNSNWQYPTISKNITVTEQQQFLHQQILQQQILLQQYRPQTPELNLIPNWHQQSQRRNQCKIQTPNQQQSESQQQFQLQFQTQNQYHQEAQRQPIAYLPYATQSYQIQSQVQLQNLLQLPYLQPHIQVQPYYLAQQQQPLQFPNIPLQHPVIPPQLNPAALNPELAQQILHQHQMLMMAHFMQTQNQEQQQPQRQQKDKHKKQKFDN